MGVYCTHRVLCYLSAFGLFELDLLKSSGQSLSQKQFGFQSTQNSYKRFFNLDLMPRIAEFRPVLFWSGLLLKGKLPVQSLVPSLSLNNLLPFTIYFSSIYLSLNKIIHLRIGKNKTPPDRQKTGHLRIGKIKTPPDWQTWDPSGLAKLGPLRIGKLGTHPDWQTWDPSGLAKLGPLRIVNFGTPPD